MQHSNLDLNLHSRHLGAFGLEGLKKITSLKVFIYGLKGVIMTFILSLVYSFSLARKSLKILF